MAPEGFPHTFSLRDSTQVQLAILKQEEGKTLHAFYRGLPEEDRLNLKEDVRLNGWVERFLAKVSDGSIISLVAKVDGEIVGEGSLYRTFYGWTRHVGEIRLTVGPAWRRKGLGRALATGLVKIATDLGIEKIVVRVVENQVAAFHIAQRLGFMKEAVLRRHVVDLAGNKRDLLILANDVTQIWSTLEAMLMDYEPDSGQ